jgi:hypothetical protein
MKTGRCARQVLVSSPVVGITRCGCGHVHVELGATTVRFDEAAFAHVARAFAAAARRLDATETPPPVEGEA